MVSITNIDVRLLRHQHPKLVIFRACKVFLGHIQYQYKYTSRQCNSQVINLDYCFFASVIISSGQSCRISNYCTPCIAIHSPVSKYTQWPIHQVTALCSQNIHNRPQIYRRTSASPKSVVFMLYTNGSRG